MASTAVRATPCSGGSAGGAAGRQRTRGRSTAERGGELILRRSGRRGDGGVRDAATRLLVDDQKREVWRDRPTLRARARRERAGRPAQPERAHVRNLLAGARLGTRGRTDGGRSTRLGTHGRGGAPRGRARAHLLEAPRRERSRPARAGRAGERARVLAALKHGVSD